VASFISSTTAGTCSIVAVNPILVIRTRLMSQTSISNRTHARSAWQYKSGLDAARQIYRKEGISTFYSGLAPALLGISHLAIQFPLYEQLKRSFTGTGLGENNGISRYNTLGVLAAASLSKIVASSATYPHEVIRTRLQTQQSLRSTIPASPWHGGIMKTTNTIWLKEGWRGFYAGMGTGMIRAVPASVTTMLVYENVLGLLMALKNGSERKSEKANL
jgi:solute carrier family 25 folate transporter 32